MAKLVSQVYAEALFGLGVENGLLDTLLEELNGMCEILGKNPQFVTLLGHPELDQKEKTAVFDRVFDGKISKELNGFCHLLLEKGRFGELFAIREDYERRCLAYHKNRSRVCNQCRRAFGYSEGEHPSEASGYD